MCDSSSPSSRLCTAVLIRLVPGAIWPCVAGHGDLFHTREAIRILPQLARNHLRRLFHLQLASCVLTAGAFRYSSLLVDPRLALHADKTPNFSCTKQTQANCLHVRRPSPSLPTATSTETAGTMKMRKLRGLGCFPAFSYQSTDLRS